MVSASRKLLIRAFVLTNILKKRKKRYWVHPLNQNRRNDGEHLKIEEMYRKYPDKFFHYTRMLPCIFDKLYTIVGPLLQRQNTRFRECVGPKIRLYVLLRYLATGDHIRTIATSFSLGISTVWYIIRDDMSVFWSALKRDYMKCPKKEDWLAISEGFKTKWNYPNCLGAVDGKHVVIRAPADSGSLYLNYKGTFSIILMATCDGNYNFTTVDVGAYGKQSDGGVFHSSKLGQLLREEKLDIPAPCQLPGSAIKIPYHFIGDEAFPLSLNMMRPFPGKVLNNERRIFNYRLSRARRCIENAFGIMAARFRIFQKPIDAQPKHVEQIVLACTVLHNYIKKEEENSAQRIYCPNNFGDSCDDSNGQWRQELPSSLLSVRRVSVAAYERMSKQMRDELCFYFKEIGSVPWQNESVGLTT